MLPVALRDGATPLAQLTHVRRRLVHRAATLLHQWGYEEIDVPLLSAHAALQDAVGPDVDRELFRVVDRAGDLMYVRGDMTPTVALQVARGLEPGRLPLRVFYAHHIARLDRDFAREQREAYVVGFELFGPPSPLADLEALVVATDLVEALQVPEPELVLSHVGLARAWVSAVAPSSARHAALHAALGERDPVLAHRLARAEGTPDALARLAFPLCRVCMVPEELDALIPGLPDVMRPPARSLQELCTALCALGWAARLRLDLGSCGDRSYYTGMQFRLLSRTWGTDIGSGGRYDRLMGHFGHDVPAVGCSLRMDRLLRALPPSVAEAPTVLTFAPGPPWSQELARALDARRRGEHVCLQYPARPDRNQGEEP
jgi:ATP phosphoribosyltransferase regulatory subunit